MPLARERLTAITSDGLRLSITHLWLSSGATRGAVLLQHGLGSNGLIFLVPGLSLAEHLAELGFDCYVSELRGAGQSDRPRGGWRLNDYLERDLPALLATVLERSAQRELAWIGHSMGGLLSWMYAIEHPEAPIARLVTVGSALDYRVGRNVYQDLRRLRPLGRPLRELPFAALSRLAAPFVGFGPLLPPERMNFHRPNVERRVSREILTRGFSSIPFALFDDLNTTFDPDGFSRLSSERGRIVYLERLSSLRMPMLLIGGSRDVQCPPPTLGGTLEHLRDVPDKHSLLLGKSYGHTEDYGHLDLVVGRRSRVEVWPTISAFLGAPERATAAAQ